MKRPTRTRFGEFWRPWISWSRKPRAERVYVVIVPRALAGLSGLEFTRDLQEFNSELHSLRLIVYYIIKAAKGTR